MSEATSARGETLDSPQFNIGTLQALTAGITQRQSPPARLRPSVANRFGDLYGASPIMQQLFRLLSKVAPSQAVVLLKGESGAMVGLKASDIAAVPLEEAGTRQRAPDLEYYRMARMLAK